MISVKTYQDLLQARESGREQDVIDFIRSAIADHKSSHIYKMAVDAQLYYEGENPTINKYEKVVYNMNGLAEKDMYTANHKIASSFFGFDVDQSVSYLLGNGITFKNDDTLKKLGLKFYEKVCETLTNSMVGGVGFGFWNLDHMDIFGIEEFVPLEDEENGALKAGVRFWQVASNKPLRATLYELDGYTEYIQRENEDMTVLQDKRAYKIHITGAQLDNTRIYNGENYPDFPIVPMKNNKKCRCELSGKHNTIDALDLCTSNMVNNADDNITFWILTNCCGMDMRDAQKFIDTVRKTHVAFMDNAEDGAHAEPKTIQAPYEGIEATIERLERRLYQDFQALDTSDEAFNSPTATGLRFRYAALDLKTDRLERNVTEFINGILRLAGIEDEPSYTRNKIINTMEEMQTLVMMEPYVDDEYMTTKALTIVGDADMVEEILKRRAADDLARFDNGGGQNEENEAQTSDEAIDTAEELTGKTLNGSQTSSLITVIRQLGSGGITEGQAVKILMTSIGVSRDEALAIIRGDE